MGVNKREEIKKAYPYSPTWPRRVDKMSEGQVLAIYNKFRREGKI